MQDVSRDISRYSLKVMVQATEIIVIQKGY